MTIKELTDCEKKILELKEKGFNMKHVAKELNLAPRTIYNRHFMAKKKQQLLKEITNDQTRNI